MIKIMRKSVFGFTTRSYTHGDGGEGLMLAISDLGSTIYVVKTKELILAFVFAYAKSRFSQSAAQIHLLIKPCYVSALQL